jgi:hypothetical protein
MMECENKIWDIFWGNIISEKHLGNHPQILDQIAQIVGNENVSRLHEGSYWFNLDCDIEKFDNSIYDEKRKRLYSLFNNAETVLTIH